METIRDIVVQELYEERYNRKHIDAKIRKEIEANKDMQAKLEQGVALVKQYMAGDYYQSKNNRILQLKGLSIHDLVMDIFVGVAYCHYPELFTSVTAKMAGRLKFSDKAASITTIAEIMAVLCNTDAFDINKANKMASLMIQSRIPLSDQLIEFVINSEYLPPMVCEPRELISNYCSGYLTHNDSLILGTGNHHDGDICLDVLNIANSVQLKLDTEFLSKVEEQPTFDLDTIEKVHHWNDFKKQSYAFYSLVYQAGNRFFMTHKVDKRGRIYAQGYHISTQGTAFKKAAIELYREEFLEGMP